MPSIESCVSTVRPFLSMAYSVTTVRSAPAMTGEMLAVGPNIAASVGGEGADLCSAVQADDKSVRVMARQEKSIKEAC